MENKWINLAEIKILQELQKQEEIEAFRYFSLENQKFRQNILNYKSKYYTEDGINYRTPEYADFVVGLKLESSHWFSNKTNQEWSEFELTEENIRDFKELWRCDTYPTEFRIKI